MPVAHPLDKRRRADAASRFAMNAALLRGSAELRLNELASNSGAITLVVQAARASVPCPDC